MATVAEAKLHFHSAVQCLSLGEKQRMRHALIADLSAQATMEDTLFQATRQLTHKEMNGFHGRLNQNTLWNSLPIPTAHNIEGIACINPVDLTLFQVAFGVEFDKFTINFSTEKKDGDLMSISTEEKVVVTVPDSKACRDWKDEPLRDNERETPKAVMAADSDWEDAFGSNQTKQMRKSTNAWTNTAGTRFDRANSIDNTLPIAVGLKKNPAWPKVKQQHRKDMERLGDGTEPLMAHPGRLRKIC